MGERLTGVLFLLAAAEAPAGIFKEKEYTSEA